MLFWVGLQLCFLPWALGTMHLWSQWTSLALALVAFLFAARPRLYDENNDSAGTVWVRPLRRLWRFPLFWIGLAVLLYVAVQALNPSAAYRRNASYWWLDALPHLAWLPSGMRVPFASAGPWRALLILTAPWLTLCAVWIGLMRRRSYQLLFIVLVCNGVLLAGFGFAQLLTHARAIYWCVPSSNASFIASFIYRNHAGAYLNLVVALAVGLAWWEHSRAARRFEKSSPAGVVLFGALLLGTLVLFSLSRGASITLLLFTLAIAGTYLWRQLRSPAYERNLPLLLSVAFLGVVFVGIGFYSLKAGNIWARFEGLVADPVASAQDRLQAHQATWEMLRHRPLFGWGAGCFRYEFPRFAAQWPDIYYSTGGRHRFWEHAHNDLLEFPAEYGVAGCALFVAGLGWLGWQLVRRRFWKNPLALPVGLGCGLTLLHAWADFVFQNPAVLTTWAVLLLGACRWAELDQHDSAAR